MTETINGLHKCQPKNEPQQGEVKNMVVLNMPAKNGKKAWIKIKSEQPEKGGSPYRILNVEKLPWEPDQYGNLAFNLEVEASSSPPSAFQQTKAVMQQGEPDDPYPNAEPYPNAMADDRPAYPNKAPQSPPLRQNYDSGPMSKDDYWRRKEDRDEERQRFIIRQHSQSMAIEVLKLKVTLNELTVEDLTPVKLRVLADYFDNDVLLGTTKNGN